MTGLNYFMDNFIPEASEKGNISFANIETIEQAKYYLSSMKIFTCIRSKMGLGLLIRQYSWYISQLARTRPAEFLGSTCDKMTKSDKEMHYNMRKVGKYLGFKVSLLDLPKFYTVVGPKSLLYSAKIDNRYRLDFFKRLVESLSYLSSGTLRFRLVLNYF